MLLTELTPFHAVYKAHALSNYTFGRDKLIAALASSDMEVYPYQVAAALFALRSPYLKGVVLCDEGSLGKTFEAMLVVTQLWYEGRNAVLIVVPAPLLAQWKNEMENRFPVPVAVVDSADSFEEALSMGTENPFDKDAVVLTTYEFAVDKAEWISKRRWDIAVFDEAHRIGRAGSGENREAAVIGGALGDAFKLLVTSTPMRNSILDLRGLIRFIEKNEFPDEKAFYARYFRKPENYPELSGRVRRYCFRATKKQVENYVKIPVRIPVTVEFSLTAQERRLYGRLERYVKKTSRAAFPKMEQYDLALMLFKAFSSSAAALEQTLSGALERLKTARRHSADAGSEYEEVKAMLELCSDIGVNAKSKALLKALKDGFARLKRLGAAKKALIFTENRATLKYLKNLLSENGYRGKVLTYHGGKSRDYSVIERFAAKADVLIATDAASEGFNLEFCSFVINYDIPYDILTMEQRIARCHRQGQKNDVLCLSFLNRDNFADVRVLELIKKRIKQFDGIIGLDEPTVGNFGADFSEVIGAARSREEIDRAYARALSENIDENRRLVEETEESLFTSFSDKVASRLSVNPRYIEEKIEEIKCGLWALTRYFFAGKEGYECVEETRTLRIGIRPQKVFTGAHLGRREYSIDDTSLPRSGRHTIAGTLAKNIISEIFWRGVPDKGAITVVGDAENCSIGYYLIEVRHKNGLWGNTHTFDRFAGETVSGRVMTDDECRRVMAMPVVAFKSFGESYGRRDGISRIKPPHKLDALINQEEFLTKAANELEPAVGEEIDRLTEEISGRKAKLTRELEELRFKFKNAEKEYESGQTVYENLMIRQRAVALKSEIRKAEESLYERKMKLDAELEERKQELLDTSSLEAIVRRQFVINAEVAKHG